jgi:hypothetical protein
VFAGGTFVRGISVLVVGDTDEVPDQQAPGPAGLSKILAAGAMLHRLGVFKRQHDKPPSSASNLGEPQTAEAIQALLSAGARNPQIGRVSSQHFEADLESGAAAILQSLRKSQASADDSLSLAVWIDWTTAGPSDIRLGRNRIGTLNASDTASLAEQAIAADHGNREILANGTASLRYGVWALTVLVRRTYPESVYDKSD